MVTYHSSILIILIVVIIIVVVIIMIVKPSQFMDQPQNLIGGSHGGNAFRSTAVKSGSTNSRGLGFRVQRRGWQDHMHLDPDLLSGELSHEEQINRLRASLRSWALAPLVVTPASFMKCQISKRVVLDSLGLRI